MSISPKNFSTPDENIAAAHVAANLADLSAQATASMDETNEQVIKSNEYSTDAHYADIRHSREGYLSIINDPNAPDDLKKMAFDQLPKLDERSSEANKDHKSELNKVLDNKTTLLLGLASVGATAVVYLASNGKVKLPIFGK